jgi:hypothetical protein
MEEIALFVVPVLITIFAYALIKSWMDGRAKAQSEKVRLLEEALKNPAVDRATVERLADRLAGGAAAGRGGLGGFSRLLFSCGWLAFLGGLALRLFPPDRDPDWKMGATWIAVLGFALLTYPFAIRELEQRRERS